MTMFFEMATMMENSQTFLMSCDAETVEYLTKDVVVTMKVGGHNMTVKMPRILMQNGWCPSVKLQQNNVISMLENNDGFVDLHYPNQYQNSGIVKKTSDAAKEVTEGAKASTRVMGKIAGIGDRKTKALEKEIEKKLKKKTAIAMKKPSSKGKSKKSMKKSMKKTAMKTK
jgi:hypothetical protein